jgi:radical SAM protein with 4Fe4S-binding SPASM domain
MVKHLEQECVINKYPLQHYYTVFNRTTGFFARIEEKGFSEPFWSPAGPELLDISITNICSRGCFICYRNASKTGKYMKQADFERIMVQAKEMKVLQIALGGGNPNQHPDFAAILKMAREKYGIVPSYTTNGTGLTSSILKASEQYCGAVAVSAYEPYEEMHNAIKLLRQYRIKTNIHFVLTSESIATAIEWLKEPPLFLKGINAIIFLNYKPVGKNKSDDLLMRNSNKIEQFFDLAIKENHEFNIGFDSCLVSGIARFTDIDQRTYDSCDAGRFSMFISEDLKMYPCSFMVEKYGGIPITEDNILKTWKKDKLFCEMRTRSLPKSCSACLNRHLCLGGCPILPEINLCSNT